MNRTKKSTVTIRLDWPVENENETIDSLSMKRLKVGDRLKLPDDLEKRNDSENEISMMALMCGVSEEVIKEVDQFDDYPKLQEAYLGFLSLTPTILQKQSSSSQRKQKQASKQ